MKKALTLAVLTAALTLFPVLHTKAGDVDGYFRKNGSYVKPHMRSAPNSQKWDNYGSSKDNRSSSSLGRLSPYGRDHDKDGLSNNFDLDDNNNGISDDFERKR